MIGTIYRTKDRIKVINFNGVNCWVQEITELGQSIEEPFQISKYDLGKYYINEEKIKNRA